MKRKVILLILMLVCATLLVYSENSYAACTHDWGSHSYYNSTYCSLTCTKCGETVYSTHATRYYSSEATCTSGGYDREYCNLCGYTFSSTTTSALGHNYSTSSITTAPTCTTSGVRTYRCSRCNSTRTESIAKTGHTYGSQVIKVAATCTTSGTAEQTCTVCNTTIEVTVAATGHNFTNACPLCGTENVACSNTGCTVVDTHDCDTEAPSVSFGMASSTTPSQTISTKVTIDDNSGVDTSSLKYQWLQTDTAPAESTFTQSFTNGDTLTLSGQNGTWYLWVLAKDTSGNTAIKRSAAYTVDSEAPDGTIEIDYTYENAGIKYTKSQEVTINLDVADNISAKANISVALINENNFSLTNPNSGINWQSFSASKKWTLSANSGMKTVYVIFKDEAGNQSLYLAQ